MRSTPRPLVDSSTKGAETTDEKNSAPELDPVEETTREEVEVLTTNETTVATPAPHRKAAARMPTGSGSHRSIQRTVPRTMVRGTPASSTGVSSREASPVER